MRIFFLFPVISLLANSNYPHLKLSSLFNTDTIVIVHLLDGNIAEWPKEKFKTDKETNMSYAVDNDNQTLFLAISISDKIIQRKLMQDGMTLYIDTKGKKRENRGIEFPAKTENISSIENMKLFGFSNTEPFVQNIKTEGTANIAIGWDSASVLHIEYNVPLKILEEKLSELNNKRISIGWKMNENDAMVSNTAQPVPVSTTSRLVAVPAGSRPPSNLNGRSTGNAPFPQTNTSRAQLIWTTHTIILK